MTDQNPDREKLLRAVSRGLDKNEKPYSFEESRNFWAETLDDVTDAILASGWLADHDERVRREAAAEQREKDAQIAVQVGIDRFPLVRGSSYVAIAIREQRSDA